jgi:hypothetical protein
VLLRLLFLVLLAVLLLYVIKGYLTRSRHSSQLPPLRDGDDMALDPQCQSYVPKGESIEAGGKYFCSKECAERYLADRRQ